MASKFIVLCVTASLLFGAGCSKNRGWLSRNDYSEMQDPFMDSGSAVAKSDSGASKGAGRATLNDSDPSVVEGRARVSGPKPIRQAGASSSMTENGQRVSAATYPESNTDGEARSEGSGIQKTSGVTSYSGPALSDFLQKKNAAAREVATTVEQLPARTVSSSNAVSQNSLNPEAKRAALPTISPEAENFSNFLTEKSNSVATTTQKANQQVQDASSQVNNFASWAEQQKSEWSDSAGTARSTVAQAPTQAKQKAESAFQQARQASREMADSMLAPEFDNAGGDAATPLIKRPDSAAPTLSKAKAPAANNFTADENPFNGSFEEFHTNGGAAVSAGESQQPATKSTATARSNSTTSSLDDSFRMDTGWKPAHMTRP